MSAKATKVTFSSKTPSLPTNYSAVEVERYFKEYSEHTAIQGFQYLAENRTRIEKLFWVLFMICSLSGGIFMAVQLWSKYQEAPVFVSFETSLTSISDIPFPAVTICPESKFSNIGFPNCSEYLRQLSSGEDFLLETLSIEEQNHINSLLVVCDLVQSLSGEFPQYFEEDIYGILQKLQIQFASTFRGCRWLSSFENCSSLFIPVITAEGICYSFNILDKSDMFRGKVYPHYLYYNVVGKPDWNIDRGYQTMSWETHPRRALLSGESFGLAMALVTLIEDLDQTCKAGQEGFRVSFHNPLDLPSPNTHYVRVPFGKIVTAIIKPKLILTSQNIRWHSPEKRKCYFSDERPLKYFNFYTSLNCELECLTDFVLEACGCVHLYMPRRKETNICGPGSLNCLATASEQYKLKEISHRVYGSRSKCDCKSACTELSYDVELSQSPYFSHAVRDLYGEERVTAIYNQFKMAIFSISFEEEKFLAYRRTELFGTSDIISNIGGLLSLFTGFSMISLVEIIYFLTLRIYSNIKLYGRWYGPRFYT